MTEIKRPNYFTAQFLVEKDFNDEQAYHLTFRRRHNRLSHTFGVADGFGVTAVANAQPAKVTIAPGTAIDKDGNEIVLTDVVTYQLGTQSPGNVFLTAKYNDVLDAADKYAPAPDHFVRTTERPSFQDGNTNPPIDGSVIVLARIQLATGGVIASIDTTVRSVSSAKLGPGVVTPSNIATGTITGGATGTTATAGSIANKTITGGTTSSPGNIAIGTVTGGNDGTGSATGNIAIGTITGGTNSASPPAATGNIAARTVTGGNIALGTITGGATGSPATSGNIANATITGGNIANGTITGGATGSPATSGNIANATITSANIANATITGGNIANGTITGGATGTQATSGNIANGTITNANIAANTIGVGQLALLGIGSGNPPALFKSATNFPIQGGTAQAPQSIDIPIVDDLPTHATVLFSAIINPTAPNGDPSVDAGPLTWVEVATYTRPIAPAPAKHGRRIRVSNMGPATSIDWRAVVFLIG
jgi:hypothetical protein